ncbi:Myo-inositol 2-dehydrogenase 1 [hydrothermal vent metagenome]|uniref:Myo-inositol 2-dehydrogenase 1 n=2 Tax=hydrothermal vent metagenome TaxID=652676 RepID=A0A3B1CUN2_9ZZZZ
MDINRRGFINKTTKAAISISTLGILANTSFAKGEPIKKLKVAIVGTGSRGSGTWGKELVHPYKDYVEMVGLCDINPKRVEFAKKYIGVDAPTYLAKDFDQMVQETKPDVIIVTTVDAFHVKYATRAMELGCDVLCEKPLAIDAGQCQTLLDTESKTGKKIITTFNARHGLASEKIKKVIMSGTLGRIISAEFQEYLDINHGASYFRRWHGKSGFSGTLLCHKASHHFDQMNWYMDAEPVEVNAFGKVAFYGKNNPFRSRNCRECPFTGKCKFYWDITKDKFLMDLYVACEDEDNYLRDGCVWDNDNDTYDTMTVEVKYNNGILMSYSLNAFLPYEGQKIAFNGQNGRLDVRLYQRQPWEVGHTSDFRLTKSFEGTETWHEKQGAGGHGGADKSLKDMLFLPNQDDPLGQMAGSRAGVMASLIGVAARQSIETGQRVKIADLIKFPFDWRL